MLLDRGANDANHAFAFDHGALLADFFDGCADFHGNMNYLWR
jgi:hypothetical protein